MTTHPVVTGQALYGPGAGDPALSVIGAIPSTGAVRFYQVWFRNAASFCTSSTFNLTSAMEVIWSP
jgi:hypothetical protein